MGSFFRHTNLAVFSGICFIILTIFAPANSSKEKKHYMASEFEPAKELTGGEWYLDGKLDTVFIDRVKLSIQIPFAARMSRPPQQSVGDKRKRPEPGAAPPDSPEKLLLDLIKSKGDMGMWKADMKRLTNLSETVVARALKNLLGRDLIKEVVNMKAKGKKHYMASEFEPAKELTGGEWYLDGKLDTVFIDGLKKICKRSLEKMKVATAEGVAKFVTASRAAKIDSPRQIEEILKSLVLGNEIIEVTSTGLGEYHEIPRGSVCYRVATGLGLKEGSKATSSAMASIPCGVCPRISQCTPDGVISPKTCEYYKKWLSF